MKFLSYFLAQVHVVKWWMRHYGAPSAKPHFAYANSATIRKLDRGKLKREHDHRPTIKTCEKYRNRDGRACYKGTGQLKGTELLGFIDSFFHFTLWSHVNTYESDRTFEKLYLTLELHGYFF